jgi:iron complex outermembrane recepter protein
MRITKTLLLGATMFAAGTTSAWAQTTPAPTTDEAAATGEEMGSNDIVVTASKREQTLQDTPIAVSVTSAAAIEQANVRDLNDLQTLVPSLRVGQLQSSANTNFIIRGFGNGANNAGIEPSVGVFVDGVYRSRSAAQITDLPNLQRVEVLRGPQSTLFGKNASAGIISIVTREPQFDFGGSAELSYGNYNAIVARADITGPLSDTIAFSLAGNYNSRDGYVRDIVLNNEQNERNRYGFRGQLLFQPSDSFKVRFIADYDSIDENCCAVVNVVAGPTAAAITSPLLGGQIIANQPLALTSALNFDSTNEIENYGFSGQATWNTGALDITAIGAYRAVRSFTNQDSDFTSADIIGRNDSDTSIDTYTFEARVASDFDGPFNFLLGGFYFRENIDVEASLTFGTDFRNYANLLSGGGYIANEGLLRLLNGIPATVPAFGSAGLGRFENYDYSNTAYSLFGQIDFDVTERLRISLGGNYTNDRKRSATNNTTTDTFSTIDLVRTGVNAGVPATVAANPAFNPFLAFRPLQFLPGFLNYPNAVEDGRTRDSDFSYTVRLSYEISDNLNAYATYATGFKASSINLSTDSRPFPTDFIPGSSAQVPAPAPSPIRTALGAALPNNLTAGSRFAEPEESTVYEIGLKGQWPGFAFNFALFDQTLKGFQSNIFTGTGFVLGNAPQQSTRGFELDFTVTPTDGLVFNGAITHLDSVFDDFPAGASLVPGSFATVPTNLTGSRPSGIANFTVSVGGAYTYEFGSGTELTFRADYQMDGSTQIAQGLPNFRRSPENLSASLTLALQNGLELSVWGRNLTDDAYITTLFPSVAQAGSLSGYRNQPRTYGALVRFRF